MRAALVALALCAASPAVILSASPAAARPVLVEMYTSQSCSSCPPADRLLATLVPDKTILPLSFNVTYWNELGWKDTDSLDAATERQSWYAGLAGSDQVYTPEAVVDGHAQFTGSDASAMGAAINAARAAPGADVKLQISTGKMLTLEIAAGTGPAEILLIGYDSLHTTRIGGGENGGAMISEVNVVRSITTLGTWTGAKTSYTETPPAGEHVALLLQQQDGTILGLASR